MVIISSPTPTHYSYLKEAVEAEVPYVMCEKPLCSTPEQAEDLKILCKASLTHVCVSYNLRFLPMVDLILKIIAGERICGIDISLVYDRGDNFEAGWREDASKCKLGGAAGDLGSHLLDLVGYISGGSVSLYKGTVAFGYDRPGGTSSVNDAYFEAQGSLDSGGGFKIIASKIGASLKPGLTLHLSTPTKTLYYSSEHSDVVVLDTRNRDRRDLSLNAGVRGNEDLVMAGWTDSFKKMLQEAIARSKKVASVESSIVILNEIHSVLR